MENANKGNAEEKATEKFLRKLRNIPPNFLLLGILFFSLFSFLMSVLVVWEAATREPGLVRFEWKQQQFSEDLPKNVCMGGKILEPVNASVYIRPLVSTQISRGIDAKSYFVHFIPVVYQHFQTVVIDCPQNNLTLVKNSEFSKFSEALADPRLQETNLNVWLRLKNGLDFPEETTFCINFLQEENRRRPGTFKGVLSSVETLMQIAEQVELMKNKDLWQLYKNIVFSQTFKHGLFVSPTYCFEFHTQVPIEILKLFDEVFYSDDEPAQLKVRDRVPVLENSVDYKQCRNATQKNLAFLQPLKFLFHSEHIVRGAGLRSYCILNA